MADLRDTLIVTSMVIGDWSTDKASHYNNIFHQLRSGTVSEESRQKMTEILQHMKTEESEMGEPEDEPLDSDDDVPEEDLAIRMAGTVHIFFLYCLIIVALQIDMKK